MSSCIPISTKFNLEVLNKFQLDFFFFFWFKQDHDIKKQLVYYKKAWLYQKSANFSHKEWVMGHSKKKTQLFLQLQF